MTILHKLRRTLWKTGYDFTRITPHAHSWERRKMLFKEYRIDTVLDVGANAGQYAIELRELVEFEGRIVSFEPLGSAFDKLKMAAKTDPHWDVRNYALGEFESASEINVAGNSVSSSIVDMLPAHENAAAESGYVAKQEILIRTLDEVWPELDLTGDNIYLKIDTQGFEGKVLAGAKNVLPYVDTIQIEMSLIPLYEDQLLFSELYAFFERTEFHMVAIEPGFSNQETGEMLQVDGVFRRSSCGAYT